MAGFGCPPRVARLGRLLAVVTLSIRSELGLSIDEAEYKKIVDEAMTKQEAVVKQLTEAARTFLGSMPPPG
jgi:cyanophycinase-like exopeptidase